MVPRKFEYFAPASIGEATALLKRYGSEAKVLAGGMSIIPIMKLRLGSPTYIIDINRIGALEYVKQGGGNILIGALTRHYDVENSKLVREKAFILSECASLIGDPQIRNRGTLGGSLSHCDPSGDPGAAVLALRGTVKVVGPSKERISKIDDFLVDSFTSDLKPNELLTEVSIPVPPARSGGAYIKLVRKSGDFPTVAVGAQVSLDATGSCTYAGIGLTALGTKNLRASKAESLLVGRRLSPGVVEEAAEAASEDAHPMDDPLRGSAGYKKEMAKVYTRRALQLAIGRAKGAKQ